MRPLLVAIAGGGASWLLMLLVLGSNRLQAAASGDLLVALAVPMAPIAASGAGFIAAIAVGWYTGVTRADLRAVLAYLVGVDLVVVAGSILVAGTLDIARVLVLFIVVSAWGLQYLAVALAVRLAAGPGDRHSVDP